MSWTSHREATINYIRRHQPDTVINCAAFTNVDGCETARDAAFKVNAIGPRNLALACEKVNARLIHISTDYVFPGTANGGVALDECAVPAPISAYGQTKLLGNSMSSALPPALHCAHGMALQQLRQKLRQDDDPSRPDPR